MTESPNSPALSGRQRFLGSAAWTAASRVLLAVLSIATLAVLTRLLRASDFGLLAMALVFANLAQRLQDMGAGLALILIRDIGRDAQRVGFTISFVASSTLAVLLIPRRTWSRWSTTASGSSPRSSGRWRSPSRSAPSRSCRAR